MRRWLQKLDKKIDRYYVSIIILYSWLIALGMVMIWGFYLGMGYD